MKNYKTTLGGLFLSLGFALKDNQNVYVKLVGEIFYFGAPLLLGGAAQDAKK